MSMKRRGRRLVALITMGIAAGFAWPVSGQDAMQSTRTAATTSYFDAAAVPVPFGPGEVLDYQVKVGFLSVGDARLQVTTVDSVRGNPTYRLQMNLEGNVLNAKIDDKWESWMDIYTLSSHRFVQDLTELGDHRYRYYDFFPSEGVYRQVGVEEPQPLASSLPLDDISFFYYARAIPLEVGRTYSLHRYFKESGNPVVLKVLRKETIEVPAGTFNTVVVQPIIQSRGLFGEGGEAEIYFTDDDRRLLVMIKSKLPVVGSLTLRLRGIQEGDRVWTAEDDEGN